MALFDSTLSATPAASSRVFNEFAGSAAEMETKLNNLIATLVAASTPQNLVADFKIAGNGAGRGWMATLTLGASVDASYGVCPLDEATFLVREAGNAEKLQLDTNAALLALYGVADYKSYKTPPSAAGFGTNYMQVAVHGPNQ